MVQVQAGAGGTESMDWASMIMNMYKMWAQSHGFAVTVLEEMPGEIAGIKVHFLNLFSFPLIGSCSSLKERDYFFIGEYSCTPYKLFGKTSR